MKYFQKLFKYFLVDSTIPSLSILSYVAPSGLALWGVSFFVGVSPYAVLCRPFGAFRLLLLS